MRPKKSCRIWFTQRNGSTLLCKGLEQTGLAGKPGEFFNLMETSGLLEKFGVKTYEDLRQALWDHGTSENGIFGIKHTLHSGRHSGVFREIARLRAIPYSEDMDVEEMLSDLFPNSRHIFLTRRNKIRQAVSWWKAIKDQKWHLDRNEPDDWEADFFETQYDFDALHHLLKESVLRECAIQEYFSAHGIQPMTIVYEDFIRDFKGTLRRIVDYLDIPCDHLKVEEMYFRRTANDGSEKWVQRFRDEYQRGFQQRVW